MSSEALDTGEVRLYIDFISDGTGRVPISEPVGFDSMSFITEAGSGRYAKESVFSDQALRVSSHSDKKVFDLLVNYQKWYGINAEASLVITTFSVDFIIGSLDFQSYTSDNLTYFELLVIQELKLRTSKGRFDTKVDLFSTRNLDLQTITPAITSNILLKAKPVLQVSEWNLSSFWAYTGVSSGFNQYYQNPVKDLIQFEIKTSLSWLPYSSYADNNEVASANDFRLISAQNDLTENLISFKDIKIKYLIPTGDDFDNSTAWNGTPAINYVIYIGTGTAPEIFTGGYELSFTSEFQSTYSINGMYGDLTGTYDEYLVTIADQSFALPNIPKENSVWALFNLKRLFTVTDWVTGSVEIKSTATGIDSIVPAVRLNDAQKQVIKSINGNTVEAPIFEAGGVHFDNYIFSGNMMRGFTDKPFPVSLKQIVNQLGEVNGDHRTIGNTTFFGEYLDFYKNEEGGSYALEPNEDYAESTNETYANNRFDFKYKEFETNKDEENTINVVHSETEWNVPNRLAHGEIKVEVEVIRDPYKIRFIQERSTQTKPTTALSEDNKIIILDVIVLPAGTTRPINSAMTHNIDEEGNLQLLNNSTFNWGLLGFGVGGDFEITVGENIGSYTVLNFDFNIITLNPVGTPTFSGQSLTTVVYEITEATLTNRTNEGFDQVVGLENGDNYSNLRYTPRNNIVYWESFLSTCMQNLPNGITNNTLPVIAGNVITQYNGGTVLTENADIEKNNIAAAILSMKLIKTTLIQISWQEYITIRDSVLDGKFIRIANNLGGMIKIYPRKMTYSWIDNKLEIEDAEVRLESEFLTITSSDDLITINEVSYNSEILGKIEYKINNDGMVTIYDQRYLPLTQETRYDFIKVNGVGYDNAAALAAALNTLEL